MGACAGDDQIARRLRLLRGAEQDLDLIFRFTIENWGMAQAMAYRDTLFRVIRTLVDRPGRGSQAGGPRSFRSVKAGKHRVYYTFDEEEVRIVRVLHHRMDAGRHLM